MAALATAAELSQFTKGKISPSDPRSALVLNGASEGVRRYCGWHVTPVEEETFVLDGTGGDVIILPTMHVVEVLEAKNAGVELTPDVDFEWSADGALRRRRCWTDRYRGVVVKARHGYESADGLKAIVLTVSARALSSPMGATREQAGQLSVSWATAAPGVAGGMALLASELAILDTYKRPGAA